MAPRLLDHVVHAFLPLHAEAHAVAARLDHALGRGALGDARPAAAPPAVAVPA